MSFQSKITEIAAASTTPITPVQRAKVSNEPIIGEEMKRKFQSQVEMNEHKLPGDAKVIQAIKLMVMMAYPQVDVENLRNLELQTKYYPEYLNGTLQKKCEEQQIKIKEALKIIKAEKKDPEKASEEFLDMRLARIYEGYDKLSKAKKQELRDNEVLKILKIIKPEAFVNVKNPERNNKKQINEFQTKFSALMFSFQTGKIKTGSDFEAILNDPHRIDDLTYEWTETIFNEHPDILEKFKAGKLTPRDGYYTKCKAYKQGQTMRKVAAENNMTLEELEHSDKKTGLKLAYYEAHESELLPFEKKELRELRKEAETFRGDLIGVNNVASETNYDTSLTEEIYLTDGINLEDEEIVIETKEDLEKLAGYKAAIKEKLNECNTPDELKTCIKEIRSKATDEHEAAVLDKMMNHIIAEQRKNNPDSLLSVELYLEALNEIGVSSHMAVMTSTMGDTKTQMAYADIVEPSEEMSDTQKAGVTVNIISNYETNEAKLYALNKMTNTGIQEVLDVLPETYGKLDEDTAKTAYEYAMNSGKLTDEQKAIIARDTIDNTQNADLKKFYQDLANKYNVDYVSVPPKAERPQSTKQANNASNNKVENTNFTQKEVREILNQPQNNNILVVVGNGIKETVDIILGHTPDNSISGKAEPITSLNSAISRLKSGSKLCDVFRESNATTKKELVELICTYGKTAIGELIKVFGGQTVYSTAKTSGAKALIKKEIERIALSNSTQRLELAQIKKTEEKDSLQEKA